MKKVLLYFFIGFVMTLQAQQKHEGVIIHRDLADFGEVENWVSKIDSFLIENTTNQTIYILKKQFPRGFEVSIPKRGIPPKSAAYIRIIYQPKEKGRFNENLEFYHSKSKKPFEITYRGEIKSLDPFFELACPTFNGPVKDYSSPLKIIVIDSTTGAALSQSQIEIWDGENVKIFETENRNYVQFKAEIGPHLVVTGHSGYETKAVKIRFYPALKEITIGLIPTKEEAPILIESQPLAQLSKLPKLTPEIIPSNEGYTPLEDIDTIAQPKIDFSELELNTDQFKANNLVFLLDISASMIGKDKITFVKEITAQLLRQIRPIDKISILVYADDVSILLEHDQISNPDSVSSIINGLRAGGSTQGGNAIKKAYVLAEKYKIENGNNQVIIFTDGGFNGLGSSLNHLKKVVHSKVLEEEIYFSALTFGKNKYGKRVILELTEEGKGNYLFVDEGAVQNQILLQLIKLQSFIE